MRIQALALLCVIHGLQVVVGCGLDLEGSQWAHVLAFWILAVTIIGDGDLAIVRR